MTRKFIEPIQISKINFQHLDQNNMADIYFYQEDPDEETENVYSDGYGGTNPDAGLTPIAKMEKYASSDNIFNRQMVARTALDTLRQVVGLQEDVETVFSILARLGEDVEAVVRAELMEQVPHIAMYCQEVPDHLIQVVPLHLLPLVVKFLTDKNNQVRKTSQAALLVLLEQGLVEKSDVEQQVCPVIIKFTEADSLDDYRTEAVALLSKMAPMIGREMSERLFLDRFAALCTDPLFHVRKVCAANFGDFSGVVGPESTEKILLPKFFFLCEDGVWGVRKACADVFMPVSCVCSPTIRQTELSPLFINLLRDPSRWVRMAAFQALGPFISTFADPAITALLHNENGEIIITDPEQLADRLNMLEESRSLSKQQQSSNSPSTISATNMSDQHSNGGTLTQSSSLSASSPSSNSSQQEQPLHNQQSAENSTHLSVSSLENSLNNNNESIDNTLSSRNSLANDTPGNSDENTVNNNVVLMDEKEEDDEWSSQLVACTKSEDSAEERRANLYHHHESSKHSNFSTFLYWREPVPSLDLVDIDLETRSSGDNAVTHSNNHQQDEVLEDDADMAELESADVAEAVSPLQIQQQQHRLLDSVRKDLANLQTESSTDEQQTLDNPCTTTAAADTSVITNVSPQQLDRAEEQVSETIKTTATGGGETGKTDDEHVDVETEDDHKTQDEASAAAECEPPLYEESSGTAAASQEEDSSADNGSSSTTADSGATSNGCQSSTMEMFHTDKENSESISTFDPGNRWGSYSSLHSSSLDSRSADAHPPDHALPKGPPETDQSIVPQLLIDHYVSMIDPSRAQTVDNDIARHCAFSLPAVALTLGRANWPLLKETYETLASDMQWKVRRTLASSIHELGVILGGEVAAQDLVPIFNGFIKDLDEVRIGILKHLADFLKLLQEKERIEYLPKLEEFLKMDNERNWRFRLELTDQLGQIVELYSADHIKEYLAPIALTLIQDKVSAVRLSATVVVSNMVRLQNSTLNTHLLAELADKLAYSSFWSRRQTFGVLCGELVTRIPYSLFSQDLLPHLLELTWDRVPNVRMQVAKVLGQSLPDEYYDDVNLPSRDLIVKALTHLAQSKDLDVREAATLTHRVNPSSNPTPSERDSSLEKKEVTAAAVTTTPTESTGAVDPTDDGPPSWAQIAAK